MPSINKDHDNFFVSFQFSMYVAEKTDKSPDAC